MTDRGRRGPTEDRDAPVDTGEWVDVGTDGRWHPSIGERIRSFTILAVALGVLLVLAAVASVDDGESDEVVASTSTTLPVSIVPTTTTTTAPNPASLAGEPAPADCAFDNRDARPLRSRSEVEVQVRNATFQNGYAGDATDALAALGYVAATPANAEVRPVTSVAYRPGFCAEGDRVRSDLELPDAELAPLDPDAPTGPAAVVITLGRNSV